jgi:hypothetical protein
MELIQQLTSTLGIGEEQAKGGAGLIFNLAKEKLGAGDFGQIANAVPGMDGLLDAAPSTGGGGIGGMLGGIASSLGAGNLGSIAELAGGFDKLGLDADMIQKFLPVVLDFVGEKGGDSVKGLLGGILK